MYEADGTPSEDALIQDSSDLDADFSLDAEMWGYMEETLPPEEFLMAQVNYLECCLGNDTES